MRLLVRPRDSRFCGSVHALRSAYNNFTLVEPFPNGNLYFKRAVDRPVCVYIIADQLFLLSTELSAFSMTPIGGGRFHLERDGRFLSPGDYLDDDTCAPTTEWTEGRAWEAFRLIDAPSLDQRERATIAGIDRMYRCADDALVSDEIEAEVRAYLASISGAPAKPPGPCSRAKRASGAEREIGWGFRGSVDVSRRSFAAGWAARDRDPTSVSVFVNNVRAGEAHCTGERPDVKAAGFALLSAWTFEFSPPLEAADRVAFRFPDGSPLRLAADAQETALLAPMIEASHASLVAPPAAGPADSYEGHVDVCDAAYAEGWAARGLQPAVVEVFVNENRIGETHPTTGRPDVAKAGYALHSGWSFQFTPPLGATDRVAFRFEDGSLLRQAAFEQAPCLVVPSSHPIVSVAPSAPPVSCDRYVGSVDFCNASYAAGWAARGLEPATVYVFINGTPTAEVNPDGERLDVATAGYALCCAWSFEFSRPLKIDDRVAFLFADGSVLPFAAGGDHGGWQNDVCVGTVETSRAA